MIKKLKPNQINYEKYQACIEHSVQKNWYAQMNVLDFLSPNWEVLVMGDYDAVMPIPVCRKWGIKLVAMPLFCQQLGIFSRENSQEVNDAFFKALLDNYKVVNYQFNSKNTFSHPLDHRKNYVVPRESYYILRKSYFKGRKSTVKSAQYLNYKESDDVSHFIPFIQKHVKGLQKEKDITKLISYLSFLSSEKRLLISQAYKENDMVSCALWINDTEQNALIALINNDAFKKDNGASFVVDAYLQKYSEIKQSNFMGGSIRGIEVFFKSFGAQLHDYPTYTNRWLSRLLG